MRHPAMRDRTVSSAQSGKDHSLTYGKFCDDTVLIGTSDEKDLVAKNPTIDLIKGVLMLLVMAGHAMELVGAHSLVLWVGSGFRMPLMFGISGYLLNVVRIRRGGLNELLSRYGRRMLLPWFVATIIYLIASQWPMSWTTLFDLLLRPPFHLWYVPVLFFLILVTWMMSFSPLILLALGAPCSLAIMYAFGLNHGPILDGFFAPDSRFLRYPVYFFFGMTLAQTALPRRFLAPVLLLCGIGLAWWSGLYGSESELAYVPARLLMCLGLIALLPVTSVTKLEALPLNAIGRDSLFFYLWHPMVMGVLILTGIGPVATLALSVLLLAMGGRFAARNGLAARLLGASPVKQRTQSAAPTPALATP